MRCTHQRGIFSEVMEATHSRWVVDGVLDTAGENEMDNIVRYEYRCADCQRVWVAPTLAAFRPKWLRRIAKQMHQGP